MYLKFIVSVRALNVGSGCLTRIFFGNFERFCHEFPRLEAIVGYFHKLRLSSAPTSALSVFPKRNTVHTRPVYVFALPRRKSRAFQSKMFHSRGTVAHVKTRSEVSHELKMEKKSTYDRYRTISEKRTFGSIYTFVSIFSFPLSHIFFETERMLRISWSSPIFIFNKIIFYRGKKVVSKFHPK